MLNLLRNSAQALYADKLNPDLTIFLRTRYEPDYVLVEVADNGPGIDDEIKDHIFEPFYTTKPVGEGTGLGLSVSYMIVTANHNGTMEITTKSGEGTTMSIRLPLVRDGK